MKGLSASTPGIPASVRAVVLALGLAAVGAAVPPGEDAYEGFGAASAGGDGKPIKAVAALTDAAVRSAFQSAASTGSLQIVFQVQGDISLSSVLPVLTKPFVTVEGQGGITLWAEGAGATGRAIEVLAPDVVLRNFRIRNGGDNISLKAPTERLIISHVTSSGAYDDGMSVAYGTKNATIQWCMLAGNTRNMFVKYNSPSNVSIHHNLFEKQWIRGPLVSGATFVDVRNNIQRNWNLWGSRFESGATGNAVNNLFWIETSGGNPDNALYPYSSPGPCYFSGNVARNCNLKAGTSSTPIAVAAVTTDTAAAMEPWVMARAGCSPRNSLDALYIKIATYPTVNDGSPLRLAAPGNKAPTAKAAASVTTGRTISYDGSGSTDTDGTVAKWYWNFGDGRTWVSGKTGTHTYAANGTYWVTLLAEDDYGAQGKHQVQVTVGSGSGSGSLAVTPAGGLSSSGAVGGPFSPSSATYTLLNPGTASINWTAAKTQAWLTLSSAGGTLAAGGSATVTASINSTANSLAAGTYNDTITFTNTTNGTGNATRAASLTVSSSPPPPPPPSGMFSDSLFVGIYEGTMKAFDNTGTSSPVWTAAPSWDLPDNGNDTAPAVGDLDADGKPDLLLGERNGVAFAYRNNGTGWTRTTAWDPPDIGYGAVPALGDLDGDGDLDLLAGANDGVTRAFKNTGSSSAPAWTANAAWDVADVGGYSKPVLADLDGDGDLDLLLGEGAGQSLGYQNTGSASAPVWTKNTSWNAPDVGTQAGPALQDLDGDGDLDLIVGNNNGTGLAYKNTGSASTPAWTATPAWDVPDIGTTSRPAFLSGGSGGGSRLPYSVGVFRSDGTAGRFRLDQDRDGAWTSAPPDWTFLYGNASDIPLIGDWDGDGDDEAGVFRDGLWLFDLNGNGVWDGAAVDRQIAFGATGDTPVVGDWNGDGKDDMGLFNAARWTLDLNGNGVWDGPSVDKTFVFGLATDLPVAGDWNGDGKDEPGLFGRAHWFLDKNGSFSWDTGDESVVFGLSSDLPFVGDWNRNGADDLGVLRGGQFLLDKNGSRVWENGQDVSHMFGQAGDRPAVRVP